MLAWVITDAEFCDDPAPTDVMYCVVCYRYVGDVSLDIGLLLKQSSATTPLLLMYAKEPEAAEKMFSEFASKKQCKSLVLNLSDYGPTEEKMARKMLQHAAKEVCTVP